MSRKKKRIKWRSTDKPSSFEIRDGDVWWDFGIISEPTVEMWDRSVEGGSWWYCQPAMVRENRLCMN